MNYKKSKYNYTTKVLNSWILYNSFTDEVSILDPKIKILYDENTPKEVEYKHYDFFTFLIEKGFYVPDDENESDKCITSWEEQDNDPSTYTITINPTLNCNMHCWYCYEKHNSRKIMSLNIIDRVKTFISRIILEPTLKDLNLSFFGGEPLLAFQNIVKPLIVEAISITTKEKKRLHLSFTTNGILLNGNILDYLSDLNIPISFQITLDGNKETHDKTRYSKNINSSYETILKNCAKLLQCNFFNICIRCNYTMQNIDTFIDLEQDFADIGIKPSNNLHIDFQHVWQDNCDEILITTKLGNVTKVFEEAGYKVSRDDITVKYRCYAEQNNHVVINYDGNLFHCTARDFMKENSEGSINENGRLVFNEKYKKRQKVKYGNETCKRCIIYPICQGTCSQNKMERYIPIGCIAGYSDEKKKDILEKRIKKLIKNSKKGF